MFKHNLLIIYRNFKRFKSTFFINLIGLSTGLACTLLIYLWVKDELSIDKFHANDRQLFQVMNNQHNTEGIVTTGDTPALLAEAFADEITEIKYAAASTDPSWYEKFSLSVKDKKSKAVGKFVGKDYFNIFSYDLIQGNKNQVLSDKNSIILSAKLAKNLFNTVENSMGKTIEWELNGFKKQVTVSGVFKEIPTSASEQFDFLLSYDAFKELTGVALDWGNYNALTYVVVNKDVNIEQLNNKIAAFIKNKRKDSNVTLFLRPYSDNYLYGKYENGIQVGGRITYVKLFSMIAIFILLIGCINFINLSTAKASGRIKEVSIKKTMGASRKTLIYQYLGESILISFLSLFVAILLVNLFLPQFNLITGKHLSAGLDAPLLLSGIAVALFTGIISGSYPAFYLSGFSPAAVLKGKFKSSFGALLLRKGLVVFQFTVSIILILSVLVVYKQIQFLQVKNLGYDKNNIIYFAKEGALEKNLAAFLSEVKNIPGIVNASSIHHTMVNSGAYTTGMDWEGKKNDAVIRFENVDVNYDLIETLGIKMKEGRTFSRNFGTDSAAIILNEAAIQIMGLKDPVGKVVKLWGKDRQIIGVTKNFNFESLHENIRPLFFKLSAMQTNNIMAKIKVGMEKETISKLRQLYKKYNPGFSFDYQFLDENYQKQYTTEKRVATLSQYFSGFAILISCLGLFGLAAFTVERRSKEIGVRKVLGSGVFNIICLLSGDFTKLVFVSIVIALPLGYLITKHWLDDFAYKIALEPWYFISSGIMALVISWLTVSMQTIKAAMANPIKSLKTE